MTVNRLAEALRRRTTLRWRRNRLLRCLYRSGALDHGVELTCKDNCVFLAIIAIVRGEAEFLREWIEFHLMMGVEHFVIYDNGGDEPTRDILANYSGSGAVTRIPWPDLAELRGNWRDTDFVSIQELAYGNCARRFQNRIDWLMKIDVDEFVYPAAVAAGSVADVLRELDRERVLGLEIPMRNFGSSGHEQRPDGLVIENYTRCQDRLSPGSKSIGNTRFLSADAAVDAHLYRYSLGARLCGRRVIDRSSSDQILRLNHYRTKSREDFMKKGELNARGYMAGKRDRGKLSTLGTHAQPNRARRNSALRSRAQGETMNENGESEFERLLALLALLSNSGESPTEVSQPLRKLASFHGVLPILRDQEEFRRAVQRNQQQALRLAGHLQQLLRRFEAAGVPTLVLKGLPLARYLYGDIAARKAGDLDLWIPENAVDDVHKLLVDAEHVGKNRLRAAWESRPPTLPSPPLPHRLLPRTDGHLRRNPLARDNLAGAVSGLALRKPSTAVARSN